VTTKQDSYREPVFPVFDYEAEGKWMHDLVRRLFPICRSLTGPGNRETLAIIGESVDLELAEVPSGTEVFGWTVPDEWTPRSAEFIGPDGVARARFADNNLHLLGCSDPIDREMELEELLEHVHTLPDEPDLIPFVMSYYDSNWGFAMSDREKQSLPPGRYKVKIDTTLEPGSMTLGEAVLLGNSDREVLVSTYICHPSMANDNLSSVAVAAALYRLVAATPDRHYTYRFLFVPETIGVITWLARNKDHAKERIAAGMVFSCVGDDGALTWKSSRQGNTEVDRIAQLALAQTGIEHQVTPFVPAKGSDERQYGSPGFDLPVGLLTRSVPGHFRFYHTSGDDVEYVTPSGHAGSLRAAYGIIEGLEINSRRYRRVDPHCEPMLSKHGLIHAVSIRDGVDYDIKTDPLAALRWVLNYCDGDHSLLDIAEISGVALPVLANAVARACKAGILETI
jgi:aminopeptidase-like protein